MAPAKMNIPSGNKKADIEINKPGNPKIWHDPWKLFWWYIIFSILFFYFFQNSIRPKQKPIAYSQFQEYVKEHKVDSLIVSQKSISGILKTSEAGEKQQYFKTTPPPDDALAKELDA